MTKVESHALPVAAAEASATCRAEEVATWERDRVRWDRERGGIGCGEEQGKKGGVGE